MFERHEVPIARRRPRGADRRAPAHRAARDAAHQAAAALADHAGRGGQAALGPHPAPRPGARASRPGRPVVGPVPAGHPGHRTAPATRAEGLARGHDRRGRGRRRRAPLEFPDVELWWPHTHGTPRLHDVVVDGEVVGRVGFRTIENRSTDGSLDLWVNGVRVFCRGAVWTPGDLAALDEAVGLGLNMVRVPGIAAYESDEFHARCDELGLLVWQDLMFATFDYPLADEEFVATVEAEVARPVRAAARPPVDGRGLRLGRARAAGGDVRGQPVDRVRRRAGRAAAAAGRGVRARRGLGRLLAVRRRPGDPGRHRDRAVLRGRRLPARPARRPAQPGGVRGRVPGVQQPHRPGGPRRRTAGQRRRLGLRRRARALPAAAVRRGRRPRRTPSGSPAR